MNASKTVRFLAAAALFTLMAGAASADAAKPASNAATTVQSSAQPRLMPGQPVVVLIGTASLEEYRQSDPINRTEITRVTLAQRPAEKTPRVAGKA